MYSTRTLHIFGNTDNKLFNYTSGTGIWEWDW